MSGSGSEPLRSITERGDTHACGGSQGPGLRQGCAVLLPGDTGISWKEISVLLDVPGALGSPYCFLYPLLPQIQGNSKKGLNSSSSPHTPIPEKGWQGHLFLSKMSWGHIGLVPGQFSPYSLTRVSSPQKGARCLLHGWRRWLYRQQIQPETKGPYIGM